MTVRMIGSLVASLAAAAVFAASASAVPPPEWTFDDAPALDETGEQETSSLPAPEEEPLELEEGYELETVTSDPGILCLGGEPVASALETSGPSTLITSTEENGSTVSDGDACASGAFRPSCRKVTAKVRKPTLLRLSLAFEWVVEKEWCWAYPRVTWWRVHAYPTYLDRNMQYRGIVGQADNHFMWCCFSATSGHRSFRMARFDNCLPFRGCISSWYPRVTIETYGNGKHEVTQKEV